ncbi:MULTISPECIES: S1C family serine protease [Shouchella]|uniref:Serine protease yyxA n=3 Tax=Bacillaceae TaxID=186817 RepID=A0A060M3B3_9BACI|nr:MULTISPECIES: trypsin-like peptidase domain-containing protein [Bacillaceae]RQW19110.1 PDZ domain-containing protein [Bacillus sp. C1-1]AIC96510.1 serine protease yyxA [Shouchella lehensis G1]KQL57303.1 serine protease [Alkalicoccobacillus plakortidis]MBG9785341.1 serine protease [Shouchella lehensis]TES46787.1 PDZ domain-containing protein [Shouchella lehensis]
MGYYDGNDSRYKEPKQGTSNGKVAGFSAFGGAIIGAALVLIASPLLSNLAPFDDNVEENTDTIAEPQTEQVDSNVINLDVNSAVTDIVNEVSDAVVGVINLQQSDLFGEGDASESGTGSGVIYKAEGEYAYIVTNQHVIDGATEVEVALTDGTRVEAEVIGEDELTDLAVLRISSDDVDTVASFGDSDSLSVGEPAIAIGNPLGLEFAGSVTQGIISATERSIPIDTTGNGQADWNAEVLQTDAAINPGNSGGALININGEVIGINSMKISGVAEGLGFAIPSAIVQPVIEELETTGEVRRPSLGITLRNLNEFPTAALQESLGLPEDVTEGIVVVNVSPGSPAANAGIQEQDVIVGIDGETIENAQDLRHMLYRENTIGDTISVTLYRGGTEETVDVTLTEQPDV